MSDETETELRLERLIPMPPELVFALWIEPAQLARWWAPEGYVATVQNLDVRSGGGWRVTMQCPDGGEVATSGIYKIVEPPHRLCFSWAWDHAPDDETDVSLAFDAVPGGTRLVLVQQRFKSSQARANHHRGWAASFDRMTALTN